MRGNEHNIMFRRSGIRGAADGKTDTECLIG
jgi:hypothetical protein